MSAILLVRSKNFFFLVNRSQITRNLVESGLSVFWPRVFIEELAFSAEQMQEVFLDG